MKKLNFLNKLGVLFSKKIRQAFSLVEIMIVLFIISLGLVGILSLIVQNIQSSDYNKNNLIAYQLSQEGVEIVRRLRDSNWKRGFDFNYGLAVVGSKNIFCLDYNDQQVFLSSVPCSLGLNDDGFYDHDIRSPKSGFSRLITVELINESSAMRVISEVFWINRVGGKSSYATEALLYNWN